jgi:hypothetical protein
LSCDVLVVAGGGGGGTDGNGAGGGGGAGGLRALTSQSLSTATTVTIGSGGAGVGGNATAAAPIIPAAPVQNTVTQLSTNSINQLGSATNRAYVVESDVTNSQERIKRINRAARLT